MRKQPICMSTRVRKDVEQVKCGWFGNWSIGTDTGTVSYFLIISINAQLISLLYTEVRIVNRV